MAYIVKDPIVRAPVIAGSASTVILLEIVVALQANSPGQVFVERLCAASRSRWLDWPAAWLGTEVSYRTFPE